MSEPIIKQILEDNEEELSYLRNALKMSRDENIKLHSEVSKLVHEAESPIDDAINLADHLAEAKVENESLKHQVNERQQALNNLDSKLGLTLKELEKARAGNLNLQSSSDHKSEEYKKVSDELSCVRGEFLEVQDELVKLRTDGENKEKEFKQVSEALNSALKELEQVNNELVGLQAKDAGNDAEFIKLGTELDRSQEQLKASNDEVAKLRAQAGSKLEEFTDFSEKLSNVLFELDAANGENEKLRSQEEIKSQDIIKLGAELGNATAELDVAKNEVEKLRSELDEAKAESEKVFSEVTNNAQEVIKLGGNLGSLRTELGLSKKENDQLRLLAGSKSDEALKLAEELGKVKLDLDISQSECEKLVTQDGSKSAELSELAQDLALVSGELDRFRVENDKLERLSDSRADDFANLGEELDSVKEELKQSKLENEKILTERVSAPKGENQDSEEVLNLRTELEIKERELSKFRAYVEQLPTPSEELVQLQVSLDEAKKVVKPTLATGFEKTHAKLNTPTPIVRLEVDPNIGDKDEKRLNGPPAGKLRKYRGYRDPEEKDEGKKELELLIGNYKERLAAGETAEEIALSVAKKGTEEVTSDRNEKRKAYSPDKSFGELLKDNERLQFTTNPKSIDESWRDESNDEAHLLQADYAFVEPAKPSNIKLLVCATAAVALTLGGLGVYMFKDRGAALAPEGAFVSNDEDSGNVTDADSIKGGIDLKSPEVKQYVKDALTSFHKASDTTQKASYCRVPFRTLVAMEDYYSENEDKIEVTEVNVSPVIIELEDLKLVEVDVVTEEGGVIGSRTAIFEIGQGKELKLDWFNYIDSEGGRWDEYSMSDDTVPQDWRVRVDFEGDEHPDYSAEEYANLRVRSSSPDAINLTNAYIRKDDPNYQILFNGYEKGQLIFILKLRKLDDGTGGVMIEEVVSKHTLYTSDLSVDKGAE